jgi:hypothetical protein
VIGPDGRPLALARWRARAVARTDPHADQHPQRAAPRIHRHGRAERHDRAHHALDLALLADGVPRPKAAIVEALAGRHDRQDVIGTLIRLSVTGEVEEAAGRYTLAAP